MFQPVRSPSTPTSDDRLLDGLNPDQRAAVTAPDGRVVVLAGAGSGKTRVLTRRIAWRVSTGACDPNRCLTLTFTRKAAAELRERQRSLGLRDQIPAGTFHSVALNQLRQRWTERRINPPTLLTTKYRFITRLLDESERGRIRTPGKAADPTAVMAEIDWARARMIAPDAYGSAAAAAGRPLPLAPERMADLMVRYQQEKRKKRQVDFDDLLALAIRDLRQDADYAAAVRWRHRHFLVD